MNWTDWDERLARMARERRVPGASLAVLADGELHTAVAGVLNAATGVAVTPDSLFQIGSITKSYTATAIMRLAERRALHLDAPVVALLPEFRVADPAVTRAVAPRHLLAHTSGIAGECFEDTGRGDGALERYVAACATLGQDVPLGRTMSYCNTGYSILGRIVEAITGKVWDAAMRELVFEPLGLTHTTVLPEEALRFRVAWGHLVTAPGAAPEPAPLWDDVRSLAPAGGIAASASDVVCFAQAHIDGGGPLLSARSVAAMQRVEVDVPERWATGDHWGLGWILRDWGGRRLVGHDGNMTGQSAHLLFDPERRVAIALLANVSDSHLLSRDVYGALLPELCGIEPPPWPQPNGAAPGDEGIAGRYERYGIRVDVEPRDGELQATASVIEPLRSQTPDDDEPATFTVRPSNAGRGVYVGRVPGTETWLPLVFFRIGRERYLHMGARAQRRVA